jgi:hypothetical protein
MEEWRYISTYFSSRYKMEMVSFMIRPFYKWRRSTQHLGTGDALVPQTVWRFVEEIS